MFTFKIFYNVNNFKRLYVQAKEIKTSHEKKVPIIIKICKQMHPSLSYLSLSSLIVISTGRISPFSS